MFARGGAAGAVDDRAWLQAMLDFEAALARAAGAPEAAAQAIAQACRAERFDPAQLGRDAAATGSPVVPMLAALRAQLPPDAAAYVHRGATSQDVVDTAAMLVARRALAPVLDDAGAAAEACAALAAAHGGTLMVARTLLQQAVPTTFAAKAAGWLIGLDEARADLRAVRDERLAVQLGGAAGTLAALEGDGLAVASRLARELGLAEPTAPWHTVRVRPAVLAGALGTLAGVLAKIAGDVALLAQNEVGEVRQGGGRSSTMPHKRNPVAAVACRACAARVPGLVGTVLTAMAQEHERAAGAWHAEWEPLAELLRLTGSAAAWAREMLETLEVDVQRMRTNLDAAGPAVMAEARRVRKGGDLPADAPESYLGSTAELVERALAAHREAGR